jgi:hypothetical protein
LKAGWSLGKAVASPHAQLRKGWNLKRPPVNATRIKKDSVTRQMFLRRLCRSLRPLWGDYLSIDEGFFFIKKESIEPNKTHMFPYSSIFHLCKKEFHDFFAVLLMISPFPLPLGAGFLKWNNFPEPEFVNV